MNRLLVLAVVAPLAGLLAVLLQRWRPGGPVATGWSVQIPDGQVLSTRPT